MEAIFSRICKDGKLVPLNPEDEHKYAIENDGEIIVCHYKPMAKTGEKMRMYAYYYRVILDCAMIGFTYIGYEGIDKVKSDYLLRAEFAKDFIMRPDGSAQIIMLDKKNMTKARLLKYLQDCIMFIENELQQKVPDSYEYKIKKLTGRSFTEVKRDAI